MQTTVEIFHNGEFRTFKQDGATSDPNNLASTYAWLTATLKSSNPKNKVDLSFNTANAALFPDNLLKPVTYYERTKTWDTKTWTTDGSNPFYQTVEITFTHECYNAQLTPGSAPTELVYIVKASGSGSSTETRTSTAGNSVNSCQTNVVIEMLVDGSWQVIRDAANQPQGACQAVTGSKCNNH